MADTTNNPTSLVDPFTRADTEYANDRGRCAYWYAAGMADASGTPDRAESFRMYARREAMAYRNGTAQSLRAIPDQWDHFLAYTGDTTSPRSNASQDSERARDGVIA